MPESRSTRLPIGGADVVRLRAGCAFAFRYFYYFAPAKGG